MPTTTKTTTTKPQRATPPTDWPHAARVEAALAHAYHVRRVRGVMPCSLGDALVVSSTAPYAGHPGLRDEGWGLFRRWLSSRGIPELAFAAYPSDGKRAGETQVMLVAAGGGRKEAVEDELARLHEYSLDRIWAEYVAAPGRPLGRPA